MDTVAAEDASAPLADEIPEQPHPIWLLIDSARRLWARKLARQSKTLREAVEEYEHRYGRRPPKGFGDWYYFAKANNFIMIDEFNALNDNIEPFLAIPPSLLRERLQKIQFDNEFWITDKTFTVRLAELGRYMDLHGPMVASNERPEQMLKLLNGLSKYLPDMNITITGHDNPWIVLSGESKANLVAAARSGQCESLFLAPSHRSSMLGLSSSLTLENRTDVSIDEAEEVNEQWELDGWAAACPPNSPLRSVPKFDDRIVKQKE